MATLCENGTLPPAEASTSQGSSSSSQKASSAATSIIRGQKRKLVEDEQVSKVQRNPEYAHESNRLNCQNSAGSSTACTSGSGTSADGQTVSYLNGASCADLGRDIQQANDEQDSYVHGLDPRIQLLNDSYADIVKKIKYLTARKESQSCIFKIIMKTLKASKDLDAHELERKIKNETVMQDYYDRGKDRQIRELNAKKDACARDLEQQLQLLNTTHVHADHLGKQSQSLNGNKNLHVEGPQHLTDEEDPYVQDLHMKIQRLDDSYADAVGEIEYLSARKDSHNDNVTTWMKALKADKNFDAHELERNIKYHTVMKDHFDRGMDWQIRRLNIKKEAIACDLHNQIKLINATNVHSDNLDGQSQLLNDATDSNSDIFRDTQGLKDVQDSYAHDLYMKVKVLNYSYADAMREIECLNVRKDSHDGIVKALIKNWKANERLEAHELDRKIRDEIIRKESYDRGMDKQIKQMNARKDAYAQQLDKLLNAKNVHANK